MPEAGQNPPAVQRVVAALAALGVEPRVRAFDSSTATAADAAATIGTTVERIVKSLVFAAADRPVLVLVSGVNRVDTTKLSALLGRPARQADAALVRQATGFAIGGVPPVGHAAPLPVYVDRDLLQYDLVWAAAGTPNAVFPITPGELVRVTGGRVADVAQASDKVAETEQLDKLDKLGKTEKNSLRMTPVLPRRELFNVHTPDDALRLLLARLPSATAAERVKTRDALDRVLAEDLSTPGPLPSFPRSTMDGFAVRAADTFGASEGLPAFLEVAGEVLMGRAADVVLEPGACARIATGGMLPAGADAVVMVEQTQDAGPTAIETLRAVAPGENVVQVGEDVQAGDALLPRGHTLRPQDLGGLVAVGITEVSVARRLRVGIISGGDEVVDPEQAPAPGQIRDVNSYTLAAQVRRAGHEPWIVGVYPDEYDLLAGAAHRALPACDVLVLSAGSSVSQRDMTAQVIGTLGEPGVLVHGVSLKPGKPTILAVCGGKPVFGLPGNPVSCMVTFELFVVPVLAHVGGAARVPRRTATARLTRNVASAAGREDYVQVRLQSAESGLEALPVLGKSNLIFTLVRSDGMLKVPLDKGGLTAGELVEVILF